MKKIFPNVVIVGLGLIGGSIALELKKKKLADRVVGISRSAQNRKEALRRRAVDEAYSEVGSFIKKADLVILATPVGQIIPLAKKIISYLKPGALLTDVGSTKEQIVRALRGVSFIGGHPIAGTEESGMAAAQLGLFRGKKWVLTPASKELSNPLKKLIKFVRSLGASPEILNATTHDELYANLSHLPNVLSYALANALLSFSPPRGKIKEWAGGSVISMTRLVESPAEMWRDISLTNQASLLKILKTFQSQIQVFEKLLKSQDSRKIEAWFTQAKKFREKLL